MKIERDEKFATMLYKKIEAHMVDGSRQPDGKFHVSELLNPRLAYFSRKYGKKLTKTDIGFFIPGIAFHEFIQKVLGKEMAEVKLSLPPDIEGTADMVGLYFSEIKTSRKWTIPADPEPHYVEQFGKYLAIANRKEGHIIVIYFTANRTWNGTKASTLEIVTWKVTTTSKDRNYIKIGLVSTRNLLNAVVNDKEKFNSLPLCWDWMCGQEFKGEVRLCQFYEKCQPEGRYPESILFAKEAKIKPKKMVEFFKKEKCASKNPRIPTIV